MPTNDVLDAARREAKNRSRTGSTTHQQALDQVAREAGHANWSAMRRAADAGTVGEPGPTLADVETRLRDLMARTSRSAGARIGDWISGRMREAADRALDRGRRDLRPVHAIRPLPMDARMMAQAVDPEGGPWDDRPSLTVRCPLHDDRDPSLAISGSGTGLSMRCMAGCPSSDVQDIALSRLAEAASVAVAFMAANDRSKIVAGAARGPEGTGGLGAHYSLADGSRHELGVLSCRMLADGYPDWIHGRVSSRHYRMETALRVALAGRRPVSVEQPDDPVRGEWAMTVGDPSTGGATVRWTSGGPYTVTSEAGTETFPRTPPAVAHVLRILKVR